MQESYQGFLVSKIIFDVDFIEYIHHNTIRLYNSWSRVYEY